MKPISPKKLTSLFYCLLTLGLFISGAAHAGMKDPAVITPFIDKMVGEHGFEQAELEQLFEQVDIKDNILKTIARPAEGLPWYKYRKIFITDARIDGGVKFWRDNQAALTAVANQYGVPEHVIVAIIGVETFYGKRTGNHRVIDALSTLAFAYPKRSAFFTRELEKFLLLCRSEAISPLQPTGSYAGAMGIPQFMPSSFLAYSADHDGDGKRDIWSNNGDVFASIANYFIVHKWQTGAEVAFPVVFQGDAYRQALSKGLEPNTTVAALAGLGLQLPAHLAQDTAVRLFEYETENGPELWLGLDNFYTITRYNHSALYAMAVHQLSQALAAKYGQN